MMLQAIILSGSYNGPSLFEIRSSEPVLASLDRVLELMVNFSYKAAPLDSEMKNKDLKIAVMRGH